LTSKPGNALAALLRLYLDIAIWRRGPADVPGVPVLLWLTVLAYIAVTAALSAALRLHPSWPRELAVDVAYMLAWIWLLLWATGRRARFLQTAAAVFGFQLILAPLSVGVSALTPESPAPGQAQWLLLIATLLLIAWIVLATAHIIRAALEWPLAACVPLAIFLFLAEQLLLQSLFYAGA
jgi:hypothetical protein